MPSWQAVYFGSALAMLIWGILKNAGEVLILIYSSFLKVRIN